jgi:hypothetical protein
VDKHSGYSLCGCTPPVTSPSLTSTQWPRPGAQPESRPALSRCRCDIYRQSWRKQWRDLRAYVSVDYTWLIIILARRSSAGSSSDTASSRVSHVNGPYNVSRSRATVPPQRHYSSSSENDNVQGPLLPTRAPPASKSRSRWWDASKRRDSWYGRLRRSVRKILKHPYFPRKPGSIVRKNMQFYDILETNHPLYCSSLPLLLLLHLPFPSPCS